MAPKRPVRAPTPAATWLSAPVGGTISVCSPDLLRGHNSELRPQPRAPPRCSLKAAVGRGEQLLETSLPYLAPCLKQPL